MTRVNDQRLGCQEAGKLKSLQASELSSFQAKIVTDITDDLKHSTNQPINNIWS